MSQETGVDDVRIRLKEVADEQKRGGTPPVITVRELLAWFNASRRGYWVVETIRQSLAAAGLVTVPDFEGEYLDTEVVLVLEELAAKLAAEEVRPADADTDEAQVSPAQPDGAFTDPAHRLSKLAAANLPPVSTSPDATLAEAVTLMMVNDFSQLPVITGERNLRGAISWKSIARRMCLGKSGTHVREFLEEPAVLPPSASLFEAIRTIAHSDYILVRGNDRLVVGIVTASDLSLQFQQLAEPFLLLSEIENYLKKLMNDRLPKQILADGRDPSDRRRDVSSVADLTLGECVRLLENDSNWQLLQIALDRATFVEGLRGVSRIRNDVMHFDPDGATDDDLEHLRDFARLLHDLDDLGYI